MNTLFEKRNKFYFGYLNHDAELEKEANLALLQLLALAPPGSIGLGIVEKSQNKFQSIISIRSPLKTFQANTSSLSEKSAVRKSLELLEDELIRWRFGSGPGNYGLQNLIPNRNLACARSI